MFPSRDIKGNVPVRSVHSSLVCLSAKAAKVNTLVTEILLDSMRLALALGNPAGRCCPIHCHQCQWCQILVIFVCLVWLEAPGLCWLANRNSCTISIWKEDRVAKST